MSSLPSEFDPKTLVAVAPDPIIQGAILKPAMGSPPALDDIPGGILRRTLRPSICEAGEITGLGQRESRSF